VSANYANWRELESRKFRALAAADRGVSQSAAGVQASVLFISRASIRHRRDFQAALGVSHYEADVRPAPRRQFKAPA